nr:hypothetical protein CFP56_76152 [Quercus suber]
MPLKFGDDRNRKIRVASDTQRRLQIPVGQVVALNRRHSCFSVFRASASDVGDASLSFTDKRWQLKRGRATLHDAFRSSRLASFAVSSSYQLAGTPGPNMRDANMAFMYRGGPASPPNESVMTYSNPLSPPRNPNRLSGGIVTTDIRGGLTRRFTTNALPSLSPIGLQRKQAAGDYAVSAVTPSRDERVIQGKITSDTMGMGLASMLQHPGFCPVERHFRGLGRAREILTSELLMSESAVRRYETLLAAQRELQRELDKVDPETRREVEEGLRHEDSITQMMASSEPASPPGYGNNFPSAFPRPNRYSMNSLTSPPGIATRPNRSSTQLTSPSSNLVRPYTSGNVTASATPSHSVPGSRRQSDDEDEDDFIYGYDTIHRAAAK